MKKRFAYLSFVTIVALAIALSFVTRDEAQQVQSATPVQQTATRSDAATNCGSSATSAATITFTPPGNLSVYLTEIDFQNVAGSAAVTAAAPTTVTTTNLTGLPVWTMASGTTAGTNTQSFSAVYPLGLKSTTPGTAVTVVLPTFATNQTIRVNACVYYAQ